jgi:hypothetical protein
VRQGVRCYCGGTHLGDRLGRGRKRSFHLHLARVATRNFRERRPRRVTRLRGLLLVDSRYPIAYFAAANSPTAAFSFCATRAPFAAASMM